MSVGKPTVLVYCQHSIGLGHLVRSLALVEGLSDRFEVVLMNGGRLPDGFDVPAGVELVNLPPLGQLTAELVSYTPGLDAEQALVARRDQMILLLHQRRPAAVVIELFPFGRKKFAAELIPFLEAAHALGDHRPQVLCSVRDILVDDRPDQERHDTRAAETCNRYFDGVLVHSDPAFARLDETFRPAVPLTIPVRYTGFVVASDSPVHERDERRERVLVSVGGGMAGSGLLQAAVDAHPLVRSATGLDTTVVVGPFAPDDVWRRLTAAAEPGLDVVRQVPNLRAEMTRSAVSVSQAGYNTSMDILRARVPAVVVPYAERGDTEQTDRARRLEALGLVRVVDSAELTPARLARAIGEAIAGGRPQSVALDLGGREVVADHVAAILDGACTTTVVTIGGLR